MTESIIAGAATSGVILVWLLYHWQKDIKRKQLLLFIIIIGLFSLFLFVFKNPVASVLSVILFGLYLRRKREITERERNRVIESQAEVALQLIASFYENTGDIMTALKEAADCIQPPLADELKLAVTQFNVNKSPLLALQDLAKRLNDRDMNIFANAVILSERYGTDTAKIVEDVSKKISHRISLRGELKNEVRGQSVTIKIFFFTLPVLTAVLMFIPDVRQVLITSPVGLLIINVLLVIEYCAWYFSTDQEVIDQL